MRLFIIEHALSGKDGHYFEYDKSIHRAFSDRGVPVTIYCSKAASQSVVSEIEAKPWFRKISWVHRIKPISLAYFFGLFLLNTGIFTDLRRLRRVRHRNTDVFLFPAPSHNELLGILFWYSFLPKSRRPILLLLFRFLSHFGLPNMPDVGRTFHTWIFRRLNLLGQGKIHYLSDSAILAREYENLSDRKVTVMPIPHLPDKTLDSRHLDGSDLVTFTYLGIAREEKGYNLLANAVKIVFGKHPITRFMIQSSQAGETERERRTTEALANLQSVEIVSGGMSSDQYYKILERSDCILIPYDPSRYLGRTSGIFAEAIAFGKPVITTENTWMAENIRKYNQCGIIMRSFDAQSLAEGMVEYIRSREKLDRNAREASAAWRKEHNAKNYVNIIMGIMGLDRPLEASGGEES